MPTEEERLRELIDYQILDTPPEKELDELAEIASAICDTPISLITMIDDIRQWYKSKIGVVEEGTKRVDSFCRHALYNPNEVMVVENPLDDPRFKENPFVLGSSHVRFYAGAPLVTPSGNVLGTLCVIDDKPRHISENQKKALMLLAKKIMGYLNSRKLILRQKDIIELNAVKLKKLTDQAPCVIFQMETDEKGKKYFSFISQGFSLLYPGYTKDMIMESPELLFKVISPLDIDFVKKTLKDSFKNRTPLDIEYRAIEENRNIHWHLARANPEIKEDGSVIWYGMFQDITNSKEYESTLEEIAFDISHVLRKPVATILGFASLIERQEMDAAKFKEYSGYIQTVTKQLDHFTRKLDETYYQKSLKFKRPEKD